MDQALWNSWVQAHPYLEPIAEIHTIVSATVSQVANVSTFVPNFDLYHDDFRAGVPLLHSRHVAVPFEGAGQMLRSAIHGLTSKAITATLRDAVGSLDLALQSDRQAAQRAVYWLIGRETFGASSPGTLRYVGWTALALHLRPVITAFDAWRDEEHWIRNYCPTCGETAAMGYFVGVDPGKMRLLVCGACGTRWRYKRTACPFCQASEGDRLPSLTVVGERGLRIDYCNICKGYLKTYAGSGSEDVLLADWTSLHLDVLASDRGLKRSAASLYQFGPLLAAA